MRKSRILYLLGLDDCFIFKVSFRYLSYLYIFELVLWGILVKEGWFVFLAEKHWETLRLQDGVIDASTYFYSLLLTPGIM